MAEPFTVLRHFSLTLKTNNVLTLSRVPCNPLTLPPTVVRFSSYSFMSIHFQFFIRSGDGDGPGGVAQFLTNLMAGGIPVVYGDSDQSYHDLLDRLMQVSAIFVEHARMRFHLSRPAATPAARTSPRFSVYSRKASTRKNERGTCGCRRGVLHL